MTDTEVLVFHSHGVGQTVKLDDFPHNGETVWSRSWEIGLDAAKGSNVAIALSRLGVRTAFAGRIGTDLWGKIALEMLEKDNLDLSGLIRDQNFNTMIGIVLVSGDGSNSIILGGDNASFTTAEIENIISRFCSASYVVTGFEIDMQSSLSIARYSAEKGKKVILNASPIPAENPGPMPFVDILVVNESEAQALCGNCSADFRETARRLKEQYSVKNIVITLGSEGCLILKDNQVHTIPAWPCDKVIDTSGAGDSFLAAMVAFLTKGYSLEDSCGLGSVYAARTISEKGTITAFATLSEMQENFERYMSLK